MVLMVCLRCGAQPSGKRYRCHAPPFTAARGSSAWPFSFAEHASSGTQKRTVAGVTENAAGAGLGGGPETGTGPNLSALPCASQRGASWSCALLSYWFSPRCSLVVPAAAALKTLFPHGQIRCLPTPRPSMQRAATSRKAAALLRRNRERRRKHNQSRGHLRQRQNNRRRSPIVRTHLKSRLAGGAP